MTRPHNLSRQATPFIGRENDVAEFSALLLDDECRLLTLVGPGGIGKTRLTLEIGRHLVEERLDQAAADDFSDGVYFVALESLDSPEFVAMAIADAIDFTLFSQQESIEGQLLNHLSNQSLLLILDNYEHLLPDVRFMEALLRSAPGIVLLITSREALNLREEWVRQVGGMGYPDDEMVENIEPYSAVKLFVNQARRVYSDFSDMACAIHICRQVEGMPLAIELAAAWLKTLPCKNIIEEIEKSSDILATNLRNVPKRHQSMQAVFDHSWQLLTDKEREVFQRLSLFRGGFDQEAAEKVTGASLITLSGLLEKSIIRVNGDGRFAMHQLLRQYAEAKLRLSSGDYERTKDLHATYYSRYLRQAYDELKGPEQLVALARMEIELDNIRAAWKRLTSRRMIAELNDSVECLALFYLMRSRMHEGERVFRQAHDDLAGVEDLVVASIDLFLARFEVYAEWSAALAVIRDGLAIRRELGAPGDTMLALAWLVGVFIRPLLDFDEEVFANELRMLFAENLAACRQKGDRWGEAWMLNGLADLENELGNKEEAARRLEKSITIFDSLGNPWAATFPRGNLEKLLAEAGEFAEAEQLNHEIRAVLRQMGDLMGIVYASWRLASFADSEGDSKKSRFYTREALQTALDIQSHPIWLFVLSPLILQSLRIAAESEKAVELAAMVHAKYVRQKREFNFGHEIDQQIVENLKALRLEMAPEVFAMAKQRGETIDPTTLTQELLNDSRFLGQKQPAPRSGHAQPLIEPLTDRELEVLRLIAAGLSNREIGLRLMIAVGTVKAHTKNIYGKLGVHSRTQAVDRAKQLNLLNPST